MGCCASTHDRRPSASSSSHHKRALLKSADTRAPPPSMDEEAVKEVLSETPTCPKPKPGSRQPEYPALPRHQKSPSVFAADEASEEVSEACSLSESLSTATNLTDDGCGGVRAKPRAGNRSPAKPRGPPAKSRSLSGDVGGRNDHGNRSRAPPGGSPARRSDRSPARVNAGGSLRMVQSREPGSFRAAPGPRCGVKLDPGERSGRRSRSPATSRGENRGVGSAGAAALGRTPSARRTNPSPGGSGRLRPKAGTGRLAEAARG
ncbi:hypothetical protein BT93_D0455 [Corymbia citriodora subsp. variegata]|nr:hypothetical protein BT93_D0455 [Corymbia citriodora subsp. variegata]